MLQLLSQQLFPFLSICFLALAVWTNATYIDGRPPCSIMDDSRRRHWNDGMRLMVLPAVATLLLFLAPTASRIILYTPDAAQLKCSLWLLLVVWSSSYFSFSHSSSLAFPTNRKSNFITFTLNILEYCSMRKKNSSSYSRPRFTLFYSIAGCFDRQTAGRMTRHIWNYIGYEMLEAFTQTSSAIRKMQPYIGGWYWTKYK